MERTQLHTLRLVYPPTSNQMVEWLKDDPEVKTILEESHLYAIGRRAEAKFVGVEEALTGGDDILRFEYQAGGVSAPVELDIYRLPGVAARGTPIVDIELGPKSVRVWDENRQDVLEWFVVEKLPYDAWRGRQGVTFDRATDFTDYELLYVGISKKGNSYRRLVEQAHEKRIEILSNEYPLAAGARVTDEIAMFFFAIQDHQFVHADFDEELEFPEPSSYARIIADAEKALIHGLCPRYNTVQYAAYPTSADGLHRDKIRSYGFNIAEDISFWTQTGRLKGSFTAYPEPAGHGADLIYVRDGIVEMLTADEIRRRLAARAD